MIQEYLEEEYNLDDELNSSNRKQKNQYYQSPPMSLISINI